MRQVFVSFHHLNKTRILKYLNATFCKWRILIFTSVLAKRSILWNEYSLFRNRSEHCFEALVETLGIGDLVVAMGEEDPFLVLLYISKDNLQAGQCRESGPMGDNPVEILPLIPIDNKGMILEQGEECVIEQILHVALFRGAILLGDGEAVLVLGDRGNLLLEEVAMQEVGLGPFEEFMHVASSRACAIQYSQDARDTEARVRG
jgi:hypothetical protein